jgi:hypothetical protein
MTPHDDSDLRLLERDLRSLAEPRDEDEQLRVAIRRQLVASASPPRKRHWRPIRVAVSTAAAAAAAVAVVVVIAASGSGGPSAAEAAIIHHALTAVTPPANEILHVKVVGVQNGVAIAGETWQETSPPYASRGVKGEVGHQGEFGDNGTTSYMYDPQSNTIYEQPDSSRPARFTDPVSEVRQKLSSGQAHLTGATVIDGVALYEIELPNQVVGYFDESSYRLRYLDDRQRDGSVVRLRVVADEYLPLTPSTRSLLSVTAHHPSARIEISQGGAGTK